MINGIDKEYAAVCRQYIERWIVEYGLEDLEISQDTIEYIIRVSGNGIRDVEQCFQKLAKTAQEYEISCMDRKFIDTVLSV